MGATGLLDCDTHFHDHDPQLWDRSQDLGDQLLRPEVIGIGDNLRLRLDGRLFPKPAGSGQGNPKGLGHLINQGLDDDRALFMKEHGIDAAVLQPGFVGLSVQAIADPAARTTTIHAYNLLAARACATSRLDLRWAVLLSAEDPEWSAAEVAHFAADPHVVAGVVRPTARVASARLSAPALTAALAALAASRLALFVHGGTGCYQWSPLADGYADYTVTHMVGHMGEHMVALIDLLTRPDGLPGDLRVVLLESGVSWIPSILGRMSSHARRLSGRSVTVQELFRAQFAVVPDPGEEYVDWAVAEIGSDNVLFGSDYPHWDTVRPQEWLDRFGTVSPPQRLRATTERFVPRLAEPAGQRG